VLAPELAPPPGALASIAQNAGAHINITDPLSQKMGEISVV
jgi:hypothetical protein